MRTLALAFALVVLAGCVAPAGDVVNMQITSEPSGAAATFRVVKQNNPSQAVTGWLSIGTTPAGGVFTMPAGWSSPSNLIEVKVHHSSMPPFSRTYSPAAILSDGRYLKDHLVIPSGR